MAGVLIGALLALHAAPEQWRYQVSTDLHTLTTTLCISGKAPSALKPMQSRLASYLRDARGLGGARAVKADDTIRIHKATPRAPTCITYRVDVGRAARNENDADVALRVGDDLLFAPDLFLWSDPAEDPPTDTEVILSPPPNYHASLPWSHGPIPRSAYRWQTLAAITRAQPRPIAGTGGRLLRIDGALDPPDAALDTWATNAARALSTLGGDSPLARGFLLVAQPVGRGPRPVPFAMAIRGGGPTVHALVARDADPIALATDWTLTHELAHFALPFIAREDAWLSEGAASYYQNVLRARAGLLTPEQAWRDLLAGFDRGAAQSGRLTLREASRDMMAHGQFMRVYWSGAALMLLADTTLRARGRSLDGALAELRAAPLPGRPSAAQAIAVLDAYAGEPTFAPLAARWLDAREFPDVRAALDSLGVHRTGAASDLTLAPSSTARAIMSTARVHTPGLP